MGPGSASSVSTNHHHGHGHGSHGHAPISEQVKYAILAQQLKAHKNTDLLQQALAHGSSSVAGNPLLHFGYPLATPSPLHNGSGQGNGQAITMDDDEPKLIIDEDDNEHDEVEPEEVDDFEEDEDEEEMDEPEEEPELIPDEQPAEKEEEEQEEPELPKPIAAPELSRLRSLRLRDPARPVCPPGCQALGHTGQVSRLRGNLRQPSPAAGPLLSGILGTAAAPRSQQFTSAP